jgi:putative FmdB family regulatory protein
MMKAASRTVFAKTTIRRNCKAERIKGAGGQGPRDDVVAGNRLFAHHLKPISVRVDLLSRKWIKEKTMPIYEYTCQQCGTDFEKLVFAGDDEQVTCPNCKTTEVNKQMSSTRFINSGIAGACTSGAGTGFS